MPGESPKTYSINGKQATDLLKESIAAARVTGLGWMEEKLMLKPSKELADLVRTSQEKMAAEGESEGA